VSTNSTTRALRNRPSGTYYARVKVNGKQKWRVLDTTMFTMAKLRQADVKKKSAPKRWPRPGAKSLTTPPETAASQV
jgi:hypothetical protein